MTAIGALFEYTTMWIENISYIDVQQGNHHDCGDNAMLIQIVDPHMDFPNPKHTFKEVHRFKFWDLDTDGCDPEALARQPRLAELMTGAITDNDAVSLANLLKRAYSNRMNVIVHCVAGVCRSGAVTDVGVAMGFTDTGKTRIPNLLVKHKIMKALGWTYDSTEPPYFVDDCELTVCGSRRGVIND